MGKKTLPPISPICLSPCFGRYEFNECTSLHTAYNPNLTCDYQYYPYILCHFLPLFENLTWYFQSLLWQLVWSGLVLYLIVCWERKVISHGSVKDRHIVCFCRYGVITWHKGFFHAWLLQILPLWLREIGCRPLAQSLFHNLSHFSFVISKKITFFFY